MGLLHVNPGEGDVVGWLNEDGSIAGRFDAYARRRQSAAPNPTAAAAAGAGTTPTITLAPTATDEFGSITVVAGTSPALGNLVTITFEDPYATAPAVVLVSPHDSATAALQPYGSATTTVLTIGVHVAPTAAATYVIYYQVVGGA